MDWTTVTNSLGASITAGAGTVLNITPSATFTNNGTLTLGGTSHTIGAANTNWTNTGSVALNRGTLNLNGLYTTTGLATNLGIGHYTRAAGTSLNFLGTLTNTGSTLDIGSAGIFGSGGMDALSGSIIGGTLVSNDGTVLTSSNGTLNGVTIGSNLTQSGGLLINNNLTLANGVTVNKGNSTWYFNTAGLQHIAIAGRHGQRHHQHGRWGHLRGLRRLRDRPCRSTAGSRCKATAP